MLKTFGAVLSIARLQAAGQAPDPVVFDPAELGADIAELYRRHGRPLLLFLVPPGRHLRSPAGTMPGIDRLCPRA